MVESLASRLRRSISLTNPEVLADATSLLQRAVKSALPAIQKVVPAVVAPLRDLPHLDLPHLDWPAMLRPGKPAEPAAPIGAAFLSGTHSGPSGSRPYRLYVPARKVARPALIVMLHGCTQTAEDFSIGTRMNNLAEREGALVLYPVQTSRANAQRCWNWFSPADQQVGQGEPAIIAEMAREVIAEHEVDPARVFAAGLSAGGAEAAILGSAYPDLFAAIGVHSGLACGAASTMMSAFTAMRQGHAGQGRIGVPAIVFHGDGDGTVNVANAAEVVSQVATGGDRLVEQGQVPGGLSWTRTVQPARGNPRVEQWIVHGAGHAWSGGDTGGSYTEPRGPDASREMLRFFLAAAAQDARA